ncbi:MAG TPA: hypothetical protein VFD13_04270 [Candidatus Kapabacteria bacterium]|nr:hypothetical protein [Candidatus Kapabacteria bacterium]
MNTTLISITILWIASLFSTAAPRATHSWPPASALSSTDTLVVTDTVVTADSVIDWDNMSKGERKEYMKEVVLPKMKPVMQGFGSKMFKDVKCGTCHGAGARDGLFKMPNPELTKLPNSRAGFEQLMKEKPEWMEFMSKTMKPSMANLLSMKQFDMKTGKGFGCENCHTMQE